MATSINTTTKWAGLKLPDMSRPAFMIPSVAELVRNRKCPTCQKDICPEDFKTDLDRKEYSISGMCFKCQADMFTPAPKADDEKGLGCDNCYACVSGGRHACTNEPEKHFCAIAECQPRKEMSAANEACVECAKSIMENSVMVGKIENPKTGERCCSIHGRENIWTEDSDKGYEVECGICKAWKHVRVWEMWECM